MTSGAFGTANVGIVASRKHDAAHEDDEEQQHRNINADLLLAMAAMRHLTVITFDKLSIEDLVRSIGSDDVRFYIDSCIGGRGVLL